MNQSLTLEFAAPIRAHEIALTPGYVKIDPYSNVDRFRQNRRIVRVRFEFSGGERVQARFDERPDLQATAIDNIVTSFVRVVILETTKPSTSDGRDFTPISEVVVRGEVVQ